MRRICILGSGAREHALARALADHGENEVLVSPGNAGIPNSGPLPADYDLYVIGPEKPLVDGMADCLREQGRLVVGPGREAAQLEGSKLHMKKVVGELGIPTAEYREVWDEAGAAKAIDRLHGGHGVAIKVDGLAAGKGVTVTDDRDLALLDATQKLTLFPGHPVLIEELLCGREVSVTFLLDGSRAALLPLARDYKRLRDGDEGPNTGGMGAYSPVLAGSWLPEVWDWADGLNKWLGEQRQVFRGFLYLGIMLTDRGPKLLEINVRLGDPEAQVMLPRVGNLTELLYQAAEGSLYTEPELRPVAAVAVVLASAGYPEKSSAPQLIDGIDEAEKMPGVSVFHAATSKDEQGNLYAGDGRVLSVVAEADSVGEAGMLCYQAAEKIHFDGMQCRTDIAAADGPTA